MEILKGFPTFTGKMSVGQRGCVTKAKVREPPLRADRFAGIPEVEDWLLVFGTTLPSIGDGD